MTEMLTLDAFEEASAKVQEVTQKTGLIESPHFSAQTGNKVFFKPENMQRTGAYKALWRQGNHRHAHHDPAHQG